MQIKDPHEIHQIDQDGYIEELQKALTQKEIEEQYEPIPDKEVEILKKMNRHERRKWLAEKRKNRQK